MASIHRRPESKYWHAAWRDTAGVLHLRSTKQTDRQKALTFALEIERAEKLAGAGSLTEAQARKLVNDILERTGCDDPIRAPVAADWLREWVAEKEASRSELTAIRYRGTIESFLGHLGKRATRLLSALTPRDVQGFLTKRQKMGCSPSTVQVDGKTLRAAFSRARRQGLLATNPAEAVDLPARDSIERGVFTAPEVKMLVDAAEGEWQTLILLAYYTGARLSDCIRLEWENVDLARSVLTFKQSKTGKAVVVPLHPDLQTHLEQLASTDKPARYILPSMADKGPGGRNGLSKQFLRIMEKVGLDPQPVQGSGIRRLSRRSFHAMRHSFTSALANAGVAPELRMKLTGHTTEAVHRGYTHHELETLKAAVAKLPSLSAADATP
jgi:integrase